MRIVIDDIAAGGDGIGRMDDGRIVFVPGGLPGDHLDVRIIGFVRDFARAEVECVVTPGPDRVSPPCPFVAEGCGGCGWQHVAPARQAGLKARIVAESLRRIAKLDAPVNVAGTVPPLGYRTTVRMVAGRDGAVGYRRRRSHDVVRIDECQVAHPLLGDLIRDGRWAPGAEVVLRAGVSSGTAIAWVPGSPGRPPVISEDVAGRSWRVSAPSFFQSGPAAASLLSDVVGRLAGPAEGAVADLYAGVGLLGGVLASSAGVPLVAVETSAAAVADATANLADLDARVWRGPVDRFRWPSGVANPAVVVADPARTGLGRTAAGVAAGLGAAVLVLVSCDPASLARDARLLVGAGYELEQVSVVDLFPNTPHVEAVSRFVRRR